MQAGRGRPGHHCGRGKATPRVGVGDRILKADVSFGCRFEGYPDFLVQHLVAQVSAVRYRRERWITPDGRTVIAPLPPV
jgi:hypothetical protein